jgi:PAS domain S-box-containing protein
MRVAGWSWAQRSALAWVVAVPLSVCAAADLPRDRADDCARTFIAEWKRRTPVERVNDDSTLGLQMKACLGDQAAEFQAALLRTDNGERVMSPLGVVQSSSTRFYPVAPGHVLVLEKRAPAVATSAVPATRSPWWLSVLALGLVGAVVATLRWLGRTQRRHLQSLQAEARERQAEAALRKDIEASIQVGLCVIHPDGRLHHVNREFCRISGWSAQELLTGDPAGGRAPPYPFWPRDQVVRLDDDLRKILAAETGVDRYRETYARPDGTLWTAQLSAHRLHGRKDWLFTCVDVSREVAAQERSDALDAQWHDARPIHSMGMHSGNLLHRIAADLGTYRGAIDGLAQHLKAGRYDKLPEGVQRAEKAAQDMDAIVKLYQDLLRNKITKEPTSLRQAVDDAIAQVHHHAAQHNVEIDPNGVSKALPLILVERGMLCDVLINLLHNAISAMEKTAVLNRRIGIESYLDDKAGQVHLRVRDHGPGVPDALREKVFIHGHSTRKGGHGWGLFTCRLWAEKMRGTLTVQDNSPCGATFVLILPLNPTPPVEEPSHVDVSPPA